ncbi:MAG: NosD domain-containing protein [Candidatus Hodarchaeota archaeon]
MKKTIFAKLAIFILLLFLVGISINIEFSSNNFNEDLGYNLNSSGSWTLSPMVIDDTGIGDYTWAQAFLQAWCSGAGTPGSPYIIEDVTIDALGVGSCLTISNSNKSFIIRNCTFLNSGSGTGTPPYDGGIILNGVTNGELINNTCSSNSYGISMYYTDGVIIEQNIFTSNLKGLGMVTCQFNEIYNNTFDNNDLGFSLTSEAQSNEIMYFFFF